MISAAAVGGTAAATAVLLADGETRHLAGDFRENRAHGSRGTVAVLRRVAVVASRAIPGIHRTRTNEHGVRHGGGTAVGESRGDGF